MLLANGFDTDRLAAESCCDFALEQVKQLICAEILGQLYRILNVPFTKYVTAANQGQQNAKQLPQHVHFALRPAYRNLSLTRVNHCRNFAFDYFKESILRAEQGLRFSRILQRYTNACSLF
ncbi:hypothetical protein D3C80_1676220 [compost metagenome]